MGLATNIGARPINAHSNSRREKELWRRDFYLRNKCCVTSVIRR